MNALKALLTEWQKAHPETKPNLPKCLPVYRPEKRELVAGGEILWKPINREAAKLLSKASWLSQPPETALRNYDKKLSDTQHDSTPGRDAEGDKSSSRQTRAKLKKRKKKMNETKTEVTRVTKNGLDVVMVQGKEWCRSQDFRDLIVAEIEKMHLETRPNVKAAEDARRIIAELLEGIGGEMEKFRADTKRYLEDIRMTRFAIVTETSQMTGPLKEVRQFFLGADYKEEITRLKDFVELCERLQKLKESGFLDSVADTMLGLAAK